MNGVGHRPASATAAPGNPDDVLDAVFDFAENLIMQQRAFAKHMLRATSPGQQGLGDLAGEPPAACPCRPSPGRWTCPLPRLNVGGAPRRETGPLTRTPSCQPVPLMAAPGRESPPLLEGGPPALTAVRQLGGRGLVDRSDVAVVRPVELVGVRRAGEHVPALSVARVGPRSAEGRRGGAVRPRPGEPRAE